MAYREDSSVNVTTSGLPSSCGKSHRSTTSAGPGQRIIAIQNVFRRWVPRFALAVSCWLATSSASRGVGPDGAQDAHPDRPLHEAAHRAWMKGDLELALSLERQANAIAPSPVYMFQIARILEALGELQEAWEMYVIAGANISGAAGHDELRRLSADGATRLDVVRQEAQFRFGTLAEQTIVQVDGVFVTDGDEPWTVAPGDRQVCFVERVRRRATCLARRATVGRRINVVLPADTAHLASVRLPEGAGLNRVFVDGTPLLVHASEIDLIAVEPGRHAFGIAQPDGSVDTVTHELLPGEVRALPLAVVARVARPSSGVSTTGGWVTATVGGVMAVVGFALAGVAAAERDAVRSAEVRDGVIVGMRQRDAVARLDSADTFDAWGFGLGISGLALVSGGVVWALLAGDDDDAGPSAVTEVVR